MLAIGSGGFLLPFGILPATAARFDTETLHIIQEASSAVFALGLLAGWCVFHYERARFAHTIFTVFFVLIGLLHWIDYFRESRHIWSGVYTSVPAVVFVVLNRLRARDRASREHSGGRAHE